MLRHHVARVSAEVVIQTSKTSPEALPDDRFTDYYPEVLRIFERADSLPDNVAHLIGSLVGESVERSERVASLTRYVMFMMQHGEMSNEDALIRLNNISNVKAEGEWVDYQLGLFHSSDARSGKTARNARDIT